MIITQYLVIINNADNQIIVDVNNKTVYSRSEGGQGFSDLVDITNNLYNSPRVNMIQVVGINAASSTSGPANPYHFKYSIIKRITDTVNPANNTSVTIVNVDTSGPGYDHQSTNIVFKINSHAIIKSDISDARNYEQYFIRVINSDNNLTASVNGSSFLVLSNEGDQTYNYWVEFTSLLRPGINKLKVVGSGGENNHYKFEVYKIITNLTDPELYTTLEIAKDERRFQKSSETNIDIIL
ncbi:MAG TPA: hypothetical protein PLD02_06490 [Saprospiraceae bacterium]|nr:hypothetical protein [Saprospiraceae bacterium]